MVPVDKVKIVDAFHSSLVQKHDELKQIMKTVQEAINSDEKNSAGDKFETSREMGQQEIERLNIQMANIRQSLINLERIDPSRTLTEIGTGSVIVTEQKILFVIGGIGKVVVDGQDIIAVSPTAPVIEQISSLKEGESIQFAGKTDKIKKIY